ncbi:hypothetical protein K488DRAFT_40794 [Vararia minispora EC-137]|uniref:Uncharacterized protein n=1 Tax=Vararia minispora EC-137 TaxID=1314806 RepID=A0ACB8QXV1_9AGAM|nr:hypothetical protein K488DRAFT_40794 [Vararia minispora EC-137]
MDALVDGMNGLDTDDFFVPSAAVSSARSSSRKDRFHPLYQPPLPTPPPGITLGGALPRKSPRSRRRSDPDAADTRTAAPPSPRHPPRTNRPPNTRSISSNTIILDPSVSPQASVSAPTSPDPQKYGPKAVAPSISEIIRNYAPPEQQVRSRQTSVRTSIYHGSQASHGAVVEERDSDLDPGSDPLADVDVLSRSSIDSIAEEVRRTLQNQNASPVVVSPYARSLPSRYSVVSDGAYSPSDVAAKRSSFYSSPAAVEALPPPIEFPAAKPTREQSIAQYLRSARLTTLLQLTRSPHASIDHPLQVSLSDLGSPTGFPLVVFLGLGSVRYVMGLYDEMAECLGIRLITIDRWGLGRTQTPKNKSARGIPEWAGVVEEVLDLLGIEQCSVMAHSAGAPYALSFANKVPGRIRGDVMLLAPWVGGVDAAGYKWLKYVPNGILKAAQGAEWKIQAWMLGKPPTIAYQGIGYTADPSPSDPTRRRRRDKQPEKGSTGAARPSTASSGFSDYDDLRDFDGRFSDSRSTLNARNSMSRNRSLSEVRRQPVISRKSSRSFLGGILKTSVPPSPSEKPASPSSSVRGLKALRSMGSLRGKPQRTLSHTSNAPPQVPQPLKVDVGLGLDGTAWLDEVKAKYASGPASAVEQRRPSPPREHRRKRSISLTSSVSVPPESPAIAASSAYQAALGNALIAASHAEASRGTHSDLLQILNHEGAAWGFLYHAYPHVVRVWYGDRDEKIAENAVRWMERNMGEGRCVVKVVSGADHGLMYRSSVVVEALESAREAWVGPGVSALLEMGCISNVWQ